MAGLNLTDHFDSPSGEFIGYLDDLRNPVSTGKHLNVRSFYSQDISIPNSMINNGNINAFSLNGKTMQTLNTPVTFTGLSTPPLEMSQLDSLIMSSVDLNSMHNMEGTISPSHEGWTASPGTLTLSRDPGLGYANTIQVPLVNGVLTTVTSTYVDDLYTNFTDYNDYIISLQLLGFPAQTDVAHLDLNNSYIDFTSDPNYAANFTDSFSFAQSLNDITIGGNVLWEIARSSMSRADLTNITGIRFRLKSIGAMTFKAASMVLYSPSANAYYDPKNSLSIDTKRGWVYQRIPQFTSSGYYGAGAYGLGSYSVGGSGSSSVSTPLILPGSQPKNVTVVTKFMPGTVVPTEDSILSLYAREYTYRVKGTLTYSSSGSSLSISDISGTVYSSGSLTALTAGQEYYLVFEAYEGKLRLSVWNGSGTYYGSNTYTSGWQNTSQPIGRGYIGFEFSPINYDAYMKYFTVGDAEFARYESKVFNRFTSVKGASIASVNSPPINLLGVFNNYGDASVSTDFSVGTPTPPSRFVQRTGTEWSGGLISTSLFIGNPFYLKIVGDIFPVPTGSNINGEYKIVFQNRYNQIGYIATLQDILPNQWNHFEIPFNGNLAADTYQVIFEQTGYFADSFYLSNFGVEALTFAWEVSPDLGATFYPFLSSTNKKYASASFVDNANNQLIVRGVALSDTSWLQSYELVPIESAATPIPIVIVQTNNKTQFSVARILKAGVTNTQVANSLIRVITTKTQNAHARLQITKTKTQSAIAHISTAATTSLDNSDYFKRNETTAALSGKQTTKNSDVFRRGEAARILE